MKLMQRLAKIVVALGALLAALLIVFLAARYGWRLLGFKACDNCRIEYVNVTDDYVELKGGEPDLFPSSFVGYYAKEEDGKLYVGFKFNEFLGTLPDDTGDFYVRIPIDEPVTEVYHKNGDAEYLIWSKDADVLKENEESAANDTEELPTEQEKVIIPEAYADILDAYYTALKEQWDGAKLIENGLNFIVAFAHHGSPLEDIGYIITDINSDGVDELLIGARIEDDFYGKMIYAFYTLDEEENWRLVFDSIERNRYYYVGENKFANLGSSAFNDSFVTTLKFEDGEMVDMTYTTDPADYVQLELTPFASWRQ